VPAFFIALWLSSAMGSVEGGWRGAAMGGSRHEQLLDNLMRVAARVAEAAGVQLVDLTLHGSGKRRRLRVDIDRCGAEGVNMDDCRDVSRVLGDAIDADDLIRDSYVLEVSSPGADRPIRSADDIHRNTGRRIMVTTDEPVDGRRSFKGLLLGGENNCLRLAEEGNGEVIIPLGKVQIARQDIGI
jgi:ribosome maturation factor RimP